jgi:hypothetical protein
MVLSKTSNIKLVRASRIQKEIKEIENKMEEIEKKIEEIEKKIEENMEEIKKEIGVNIILQATKQKLYLQIKLFNLNIEKYNLVIEKLSIYNDQTLQSLKQNRLNYIVNYNTFLKKEEQYINKLQHYDMINTFNLLNEQREEKVIEEKKVDMSAYIKNNINDIIFNETKIITDKSMLFNLYRLINDIFTTNINNYINVKKLPQGSIIFILKGGNVLNSIIKTKLNNIDENLDKFIKENLKYSDLDFEIIVSDTINDASGIVKDLKRLTYILLYKIRIIILLLKSTFDLSSNLNNIQTNINKILIKENKQISNLSLFNKKLESELKIYDILKKESVNYIIPYLSENTTFFNNLSIIVDDNFNLASLKININCDYHNYNRRDNIYLVCDLIDIKISVKNIIDQTRPIIHIKKYKLKDNDQIIDINSYSFDYSLQDLIITITSPHFPWNHYKYEKRMNRLLLFFLIDIIAKRIDSIYIINFIDILDELIQYDRDLVTYVDFNYQMNIKIFSYNIALFDFFKKYVINSGEFGSIVSNLFSNKKETQNYKNFLSLIKEKLINILPIIKKNIVLEEDNTIIFKKYLKYKNKYYQLKNKIY